MKSLQINNCYKSFNMSGIHINRPRPNKCIDIIFNKDYNKIVPKPINNLIINYNCYYANQFKKIFEVEK